MPPAVFEPTISAGERPKTYALDCVATATVVSRMKQVYLLFYISKAQWLLYVPTGLTFNNSTFCPHTVLMCFVWISEQTAIISLYRIN